MINEITRYTYPDYFVKHPNIGHTKMVQKIFPYLKPERLNFDEYIKYYQICYLILCQDFEGYLQYLEDEHFNSMKKTKVEFF